jgi:GT2 family glycosyltransferase
VATQGADLPSVIETAADPRLAFPYEEHPVVSIVIPAHNQWRHTERCLRSILANTHDVPYEVIVGDDESDDETQELPERSSNVTVLRDGIWRGFLRTCNNAASHARGEYIVLLNNDTAVHDGWLEAMLRVFQTDERTGMVGAKLLFDDGTLQEAGGIIWRNGDAWNYGRLDDPDRSDYNYVREVDYVSAACLMIPRSLWEEIGGFDERYAPVYHEDTDLAFEVRDRGWKVMYQPSAVVTHYEGATHGTDVRKGTKRYQVINQAKFRDKWRTRLAEQQRPGAHFFIARDRSRDRRHLLMIDHYVPQHDKDAGGRMAYHYLRLFVELGFHVTFLPANFERVEPYTSTLEQLGVHVLYSESADTVDDWIRTNAIYIDYACVFRPSIAPGYIDQIRKHGRATKIIYYPIDLHFLRELRRFAATGSPDALVKSRRWQEVETALFEQSDAVHVLSPYEHELIEQISPRATVRTIPAFLYDLEPVAPGRGHQERANLLFVAGFEHPPNEDGLRWFVREVFPVIEPSLPGLELVIVGEGSREAAERLDDPRVVPKGRVSDRELLELYSQARIALVPLRYGAGIKGKLVEALHHGTPVVTTSVGAEGLPGIDECVSIADEPEEFAARVLELYLDDGLWDGRVERGRAYVGERFSRRRARDVLAGDMALPVDGRTSHRSNGRFVASDGEDQVYFLCNICGTASGVRPAQLQREVASCPTCNSTVRFRSLVHVLSSELFGESLVLTDFPVRKDLRGVGMSDWSVYARPLAEKLDYANTFFDEQPTLDILSPDPKFIGKNDFVICSEVLEHVPPPVSPAFANLRRLLKPGGLLVLTVPYSQEGATRENFPDLYNFKLVFEGDRKVLKNVTKDGVEQRFEHLTFHGGEGFTLEMRLFSYDSLVEELEAAGFTEIKVHSEPVPEYGIEWSEAWSLPLTARAPRA